MSDFSEMMEAQIKQMHAEFEKTLESALAQQKAMNEEMGFETTEEDREELIAEYKQQADMSENMMRQQMAMQESLMSGYGGGQMPDFAAQAMEMSQSLEDMFEDDEDEMTEEELQAFIEANPVPDEMKKYLVIGSLLIGTNGEPYTTLALTGEKEDYRDSLECHWGIENREDALEMLESLFAGRHSEQFKEDYALLKEHGTDGYFDNTDDPIFDEDDIEEFETAKEAIDEILSLLPQAENCTSLYAWDLDRIGLLARTLSHAGYITEAEGFDWLKKAGVKAAETFTSWEDYIVSILLGRALHLGVGQEPFVVACDLLNDSKYLLDLYPIESLKS